MEGISSSSNYLDMFDYLTFSQVNEIRKTAILQQKGQELNIASSVANGITSSIIESQNGYEFDSKIPEGSTFSLHV